MAFALPKWIRSPTISFNTRTGAGYEEVHDPLHPHDAGELGQKPAPSRPRGPTVSPKILYWVIAGLVMTVMVLALTVMKERGYRGEIRGHGKLDYGREDGKRWSMDVIDKGRFTFPLCNGGWLFDGKQQREGDDQEPGG